MASLMGQSMEEGRRWCSGNDKATEKETTGGPGTAEAGGRPQLEQDTSTD